jgi:long-chain acyl-CoA synthetase
VVQVAPGQTVTAEALLTLCREQLGSTMAPKSVDFIAELPRSAVGKVLKRTLREGYWQSRVERI